MAKLDQGLIRKIATKLRKDPQYIREQVSRRATRDGVTTPVALINWARQLNIAAARAINELPGYLHSQLAPPRRVVELRAPADEPIRIVKGRPRRRSSGRKGNRATSATVFISHSSIDVELVRNIVALLRFALNLKATQIRATSVAGHKLEGGANTESVLRREIRNCSVVIGVLSPASTQSMYVLFELGARWGMARELIPLTAGGLRPGSIRGPLAGRHILDCSKEGDVHKLVKQVKKLLHASQEDTEVYLEALAKVVACAKRAPKSR